MRVPEHLLVYSDLAHRIRDVVERRAPSDSYVKDQLLREALEHIKQLEDFRNDHS